MKRFAARVRGKDGRLQSRIFGRNQSPEPGATATFQIVKRAKLARESLSQSSRSLFLWSLPASPWIAEPLVMNDFVVGQGFQERDQIGSFLGR